MRSVLIAILLTGILLLLNAGPPSSGAVFRMPGEIRQPLPSPTEEERRELQAYVHYAMALYAPEKVLNGTITIHDFADELAEHLTETLRVFPDAEAPLLRLLMVRRDTGEPDKILQDLGPFLADPQTAGKNIRIAYAARLLAKKEYGTLLPLEKALREDFPEDADVLQFMANSAFAREDREALDGLFREIRENPRLKELPILKIPYLRFLTLEGKTEEFRACVQEMLADKAFQEPEEDIIRSLWDNLSAAGAWQELSQFLTQILLHSQDGDGPDTEHFINLARLCVLAECNAGDYPALEETLALLEDADLDDAQCIELFCQLGTAVNRFTQKKYPAQKDIPQELLALNIRLGENVMGATDERGAGDSSFRILADYHLLAGNLHRAMHLLKSIRERTAQDDLTLTTLLCFFGLYQEALPILRKLHQHFPEKLDSGFYTGLGIAEDLYGDRESGYKYLRKALELNPKNARAANHLGYEYLSRGIYMKEAETLIQTALDNDPENYAVVDSMAWLRFRQRRYPEALHYLAKTMTLLAEAENLPDGEDIREILDHLRAILQKMGCSYLAEFYEPY